MAKKTKRVPKDEMLLAETIASAKALGLKGCVASPFKEGNGNISHTYFKSVKACCAIGGLALLSEDLAEDAYSAADKVLKQRGFRWQTNHIYDGNDSETEWMTCNSADRGESFGWAFRNAMAD